MSEIRDYYQVLGVASDASPDQIKRRFRELARRHHPDMNLDQPQSHEVFLRINEAYEVLSTPSRRAAYDLTLRDRARREAERRSGAFGSAVGGARTPPPAAASPRTGQREVERRRQVVARMLADARQAYGRGHLREAQRLCQEILQTMRVGAAYEMLGDIYSRQGRLEEAVDQYTLAAQMTPNSGLIMAKLNRIVSRQYGGGGAGLDSHSTGALSHKTPSQRLAYKTAITLFGSAVILFLMFWWRTLEDSPLGWPGIGNWTLTQLAFTALDGFLGGMVLTSAPWIRSFEQELILPSTIRTRRGVPLAAVLAATGLCSLPLSVVAYLVIAYRQEAASPSVLAVFALSFALTIGFVIAAPLAAQMETLLFGGNLIFVSMLCGWFIGDLFRPTWAM